MNENNGQLRFYGSRLDQFCLFRSHYIFGQAVGCRGDQRVGTSKAKKRSRIERDRREPIIRKYQFLNDSQVMQLQLMKLSRSLFIRLIGCSVSQLVSCSVGWLVRWVVGQLYGWSVVWLVSWVAEQMGGWSVGWLVSWMNGQLCGWLVGWLVSWVACQLAGWSVGWLVSWVNGQLCGCSVGWLIR